MAESSSSSSGGIGFVGLLTIVFITLKLLGKVDWPWVCVLSPIWISAALVVLIIVCVLLSYVSFRVIKDARRNRKLAEARARIAALNARPVRTHDVQEKRRERL